MRKLERKPLAIQAGLITNFNKVQTAGTGCTIAQNVDTFDEWLTVGVIPGTTKVSADHGASVDSLHYFEYQDTFLQRQREYLSVSGGTLRTIDGVSGALTAVTYADGSTVNDLVSEPMSAVKYNDRLYLSSEGQNKLLTGGLRYDGNSAGPWGLLAPGLQETDILGIDDHTNWTVNGTNTKSTLAANLSKDGAGAVQVNKVAGNTTVELTRASLSLNLAANAQCFIWLHIPTGALPKLDAGAAEYAVEITVGDAGFVNSASYRYEQGALVTGWNLIGFIPTAASASATTGTPSFGSVSDIRLKLLFAASGSAHTGFVWDRLYGVDEGSPNAANSATAGGPGIGISYTYRITFLDDSGFESNAGTPSSSVTATGLFATGLLDFAGNVSNGDLVTIGDQTYQFETTLTQTVANRVLIGGTAAASRNNLMNCINLTGTAGTDYSSATVNAHPLVTAGASGADMTATAKTAGLAGNDISTTEAAANLSWGDTTLTGGAAGNEITVSAIPISTSPSVIARRIYRDIDGDNIWRFVAQIDDNVQNTFTDSVSDAGLGVTQPPIAGDSSIDHSPPGALIACQVYQNRVFGISSANPTVLMVSDITVPDAFKITDQMVFDEELTGLAKSPLGLLVATSDSIFVLQGDGLTTPFSAVEATRQVGTNNFRTFFNVKNFAISQREDEVYLLANITDPWLLNSAVFDQFKAWDYTKAHFGVHDRSRFCLLFFHEDGDILKYQYGTHGQSDITGDGVGVDPLDIRRASWWSVSPPAGVTWKDAEVIERAADVPEIWVAGSDGFVYRFHSPGATTWAQDSSAVTAILEASTVPIGRDFNGRGEVRYLEYDADATATTNITATVSLLTGAGGKEITNTSWTIVDAETADHAGTVPIPPTDQLTGEWARVKLQWTTNSFKLRALNLLHFTRGFRGERSG